MSRGASEAATFTRLRFLEEASNQHRLPKSLQRVFSTGLATAFLASVLSGLNTGTAQQESTSKPLVAEIEKISQGGNFPSRP